MIEVAPGLFVGDMTDEIDVRGRIASGQSDWYVIHACKEPFHRQALGYTGRGAPKDHPEYLYAHRPNRLILNLVDTADPAYISDTLIEVALGEITQMLGTKKVLIHCNEGKSRAPTIAMLWMAERRQDLWPDAGLANPETAAATFQQVFYPDYAPAEGMRLYAQRRLEKMLAAA